MALEMSASDVFEGIFCSTQNIFMKKQRELYPKVLDMWPRVLKSKTIEMDNQNIEFIFTYLFPLLFDEDEKIRTSTYNAVDACVPSLAKCHNHPKWPAAKEEIVLTYAANIHQLRTQSKKSWYELWCLFIKILNSEISKSTPVINTYLQIVEQGFRHNDLEIRAQSFICWKLLVEIFAKEDQLKLPKRVKLVSIPLRSAQSKSINIALNKFKVWWYLICMLKGDTTEYTQNLLMMFLSFCFGPFGEKPYKPLLSYNDKKHAFAPGKAYKPVRPMVVCALVCLLGKPNDEIRKIHETCDMESSTTDIITETIFENCKHEIIMCCVEATIIISQLDNTSDSICRSVWKNLTPFLKKTTDINTFKILIENLEALKKLSTEPEHVKLIPLLPIIIEEIVIAQIYPLTSTINDQNYEDVFLATKSIVNFLRDINVTENLNEIVEKIFPPFKYQNTDCFMSFISNLINFLYDTESKDAHKVKYDLNRKIWIALHENILTNAFKKPTAKSNLMKQSDFCVKYLIWGVLFTKCDNDNNMDSFLKKWIEILELLSALGSQNIAVQACCKLLMSSHIFNSEIMTDELSHILPILVKNADANLSKNASSIPLFTVIVAFLARYQIHCKDDGELIRALDNFIMKCQADQLVLLLPKLMTIVTMLKSSKKPKLIPIIKQFKKNIIEKIGPLQTMAKHKRDMNLYSSIVTLCNDSQLSSKPVNKDEFVVIPTVWKLNPDKLTEHQKEKMKERRSDIPALYNDMSQSQDSYSIKPWTPRNIIHSSNEENFTIIIEDNENVNVESTKTANTDIAKEAPTDKVDKEKNGETILSEPAVQNTQPNESPKKPDSIASTSSSSENSSTELIESDKKFTGLNNKQILSEGDKKRIKILKEIKQLAIDTVDGKEMYKDQKNEAEKLLSKPLEDVRDNFSPRTRWATKRTNRSSSFEEKNSYEKKQNLELKKAKRTRSKKTKEQTENHSLGSTPAQNKNIVVWLGEIVSNNDQPPTISPRRVSRRNSSSMDHTYSFSDDTVNRSKKTFIPRKIYKHITGSNDKNDNISVNKNEQNNQATTANFDALKATPENITAVELNDESITKTSTVKNSKKLKNKIVDIAEMDTEPIAEPLVNVTVEPNQQSEVVPEKTEVIAEPSTSFNTPQKKNGSDKYSQLDKCNISENSKTDQNKSLSVDIQIASPVTPIRSIMNKSIISSPETEDCNGRVSEFLNSTLNISPIMPDKENISKISVIVERSPQLPSTSALSLTTTPIVNIEKDNLLSSSPCTSVVLSAPSIKLLKTALSRADANPSQNSSSVKMALQMNSRGGQILLMNKKAGVEITSTPTETTNEEEIVCIRNAENVPNDQEQAKLPVLTFTKSLPSSTASPSSSILKRKIIDISTEEIESPAHKRKRVSFHDPPVSATKEYIRDLSEKKLKNLLRNSINRCLVMPKARNALRRKSRAASIQEIANISTDGTSTSPHESIINSSASTDIYEGTSIIVDDSELSDYDDDEEDNRRRQLDFDDKSDAIENGNEILFANEIDLLNHVFNKYSLSELIDKGLLNTPKDESAMLNHIFDKYPLNELLNQYFDRGNVLNIKSARVITKELSNAMSKNDNIKSIVLDQLSEVHPIEFLSHAVQENASSVVCSHLPNNSILNYLIDKTKTDVQLKMDALEKLYISDDNNQIMTDNIYKLVMKLISHKMSKDQMLELVCEIAKQNRND